MRVLARMLALLSCDGTRSCAHYECRVRFRVDADLLQTLLRELGKTSRGHPRMHESLAAPFVVALLELLHGRANTRHAKLDKVQARLIGIFII